MKITGFNPFSAVNQLQLLNELNLKEGQKIIGKIISLSTDEALLEIAGRPLQAKIEGNPPPAGTNQTFQVSTDDQGRVILKVINNSSENTESVTKNSGNTSPTSNLAENTSLQKSIVNSLTKDGLPITQENVEKVIRYLQDFQTKLQQPINPQVFTFIMAKKWPVTPGTVLAAWVFQDQEVRDTLWNKLQSMLPEKEAANLQKLLLNMKADPAEIESKLKTLVGDKLPELLQKLVDSMQSVKTGTQSNTNTNQLPAKLFLLNELKAQLPSADITKNQLKDLSNPAKTNNQASTNASDVKQTLMSGKSILQNQTKAVDPNDLIKSNQDAASGSKMAAIDKSDGSSQIKIQSVLDQNIAMNQQNLRENAANGVSNLIPLLINDSHDIIHEGMVQWKEEPSSKNDGTVDQVMYMTVPTEKLGDIHLALRIGNSGTRINFQVNSEEVRKYFLKHAVELKKDIANNTFISINTKEPEENRLNILGVDLWM